MTVEATFERPENGASLRDRIADMRARIIGRIKLGPVAKIARYGLGRDLSVAIKNPSAKIPISVRRLEERDLAPLFSLDAAHSNLTEQAEVAVRKTFLSKGASNGFVAVDERNGMPCYVQWLFGVKDNGFIRQLKGFPDLEPHQALLENAYTPPGYRGLGIMSAAMALIAERGTEIGARQVLTFVGLDNIASLKGCQRAGFNPVMLHRSTRLGFGAIRRDSYELFAEGDPRRTIKF
jgi:hypothetical protein